MIRRRRVLALPRGRPSTRRLVGAPVALLLVVTAVLASSGVAVAEPLAGASLTGCRGELTSRDASGEVVDRAVGRPPHEVIDPDTDEPTFTRANPFVVADGGVVEWSGESTTAISDQRGSLEVWGFTVVDNRTANEEQRRSGEGAVAVDQPLPLGLTGLARVEGELSGEGGKCEGGGWVRLEGDGWWSPAVLLALGATAAGVALLVWAQPRQRPAGAP